jgi:hypothetical protein
MSLDPFMLIDQLRVKVLVADDVEIGSNLDMNGYRIVNLGAPTAATDAATKAYVDSIAVSGTPAGANTNIQYNNAGVFAGDSRLTWSPTPQVFAVSGPTARVVVGSQTPDLGAALQLKTSAPSGTIALLAGPSQLVFQSSVTTAGAGAPAALLALELANNTAAYCDLTATAVTTAGAVGDVAFFHRRFRFKRAGATATLSAVTVDFEDTEVPGLDVVLAVSGTVLNVSVLRTANTHVWSCVAKLTVTGAWL